MGVGVLKTYSDLLPVTEATPMITLGEGDTPLVKSNRMAAELGCPELYFKLEGCNPTGSFKDRGMVVAIAKALEEGSRAIMCASTGNTSASAAAFGAYSGLPALVIIPRGEVAMGKLAQAMAYGARIIMVNGNFDTALDLVRTFTTKHEVTLVNSVNPYRLEGQKTAAFEIVDSLGDAPDYLFIPVGNAGNITAYWRGFREYHQLGRSQTLPKMMGFQAEGAAPIVRGEPVANPQTIASAIRIGNPASWKGPWKPGTSRAARLTWYRMMRSWKGTGCWRPRRGYSASRRRRHPSPGWSSSTSRVWTCPIAGWSASSPGPA